MCSNSPHSTVRRRFQGSHRSRHSFDGTVNVASQSTASASFTNPYQAKDNAKQVIDGQVLYTNTPNETWNNWGDNTGTEPWLQLAGMALFVEEGEAVLLD